METGFLSFFVVKLKQIHVDKGITAGYSTNILQCSRSGEMWRDLATFPHPVKEWVLVILDPLAYTASAQLKSLPTTLKKYKSERWGHSLQPHIIFILYFAKISLQEAYE